MEKSTWGISRLVTCFWQVMAEHRWKLAYDQFQVRLSNFTTVSDGLIIEHSQESSLPGGRIYISWRTTCRSYGNKLWNGSASWGRCNIFESVGLQEQNSWWNIALWIDVWGRPGLVIRFTHKPFRPRLRKGRQIRIWQDPTWFEVSHIFWPLASTIENILRLCSSHVRLHESQAKFSVPVQQVLRCCIACCCRFHMFSLHETQWMLARPKVAGLLYIQLLRA